MAEGKKSFVAYCDWENIFDMLSNEEAGLMVKHLFAYVNDKNPELEDRILKIAFEPIKLQLKRDLEKYKTIRERRSEAGRKGGKQTASKKTKPKQIKANEANATKCKQTVANQAVTVTVTDTDTVLSKDNDISDFDKVVLDWFEYKKERRESYKSEKSKTAFINKLKKLSGNNAETARLIVDESIANNWAGIFELKSKPISATQKVSETEYKEF